MLRKDGEEMTAVLRLAPGSYEYKFIVDNQWRCAALPAPCLCCLKYMLIFDDLPSHEYRYDGNQPVVKGRNGNINNVIQVLAPQAKEAADTETPGKSQPHEPYCFSCPACAYRATCSEDNSFRFASQ